jgi:FlaA1/EpsC-like NDP-sugar epimerase
MHRHEFHSADIGIADSVITGVRVISRSMRFGVIERLRLHGLTFLQDSGLIAAAYVAAEGVRYDGHIPSRYLHWIFVTLLLTIVIYGPFMYAHGVHRRMWKYADITDIRAILSASALSTLVVGMVDVQVHELFFPLSVVLVGGVFALSALLTVRLWSRLAPGRVGVEAGSVRVLIVGAGQAGQIVASDLASDCARPEVVVGFLDDDPAMNRRHIHGLPVLGHIDSLIEIVLCHKIDVVAVAMPSASTRQLDRVLALAQQTNARIQVLPSHAEVLAGRTPSMQLHDLDLDSLLDRIPSTEGLEGPLVQDAIQGRVVLVTGAAGSIGSEICRQLLSLGPKQVIALDNNETGLFHLRQELSHLPQIGIFKPFLTSITAEPKIRHVFTRFKPDVVFHAAAYKHVPILQEHMDEAVFVNIKGTLNLCQSALDYGCERFVFVSTDKAVHPVNALGFSKRIGERLVRAHQEEHTIFCSVRFGNVIGSRGSALPEFIRQIDAGGPVTVTHPDVERYFMTIPEAVSLVIQAGALAQGGELFMLDMGAPIKIGDLVKRIIRHRGLRIDQDIEIQYTGLRPGEKLTEELVFSRERTRATEIRSICVVEDDEKQDLCDLERGVALLVQLAMNGESDALAVALRDVACGDGRKDPVILTE